MTKLEIERKFRVSGLPPDVETCTSKSIEQAYLAIEENGTEVRIRNTDSRYSLTVKSAGALIRPETEISLTEGQYQDLLPAAGDRRLAKTRYILSYGSQNIEVDVYQGRLEGLVVAEVEFTSVKEAGDFDRPEWMGDEVTDNPAFKNRNLVQLKSAASIV